MVKKPKRLFLYLAIACFAGLVTIFVVDGYIGVHDTIGVTVGEYEQKIEADYWERNDVSWPVDASAGANVYFSYQIDNNQLSDYSAHIRASLWQENEKVIDLFSEDVSIARLDGATVKWTLSSDELKDDVSVPGERSEYTVRINLGEVERRVVVSYYYPYPYPEVPSPAKPEPVR